MTGDSRETTVEMMKATGGPVCVFLCVCWGVPMISLSQLEELGGGNKFCDVHSSCRHAESHAGLRQAGQVGVPCRGNV